LQRVSKALVVKRLQQIVERMNLKRFQGILIKRRHKDHRLNVLSTDAPQHVKPIHLGHLNVEKDQIRRVRLDRFHRLTSIATLVKDLNLSISLEQQTKIAARQRLVVNNQSPDLSRHYAEVLNGIRITTSTPPPLRLRISNS
jgi:hypothetical protein